MKNIIIVDEADRNRVQRADIDMSSRMNLMSFMIAHDMDIENPQFKKYEAEYQSAYLAFESAKVYISEKYLTGLNATTWSLDYESCELTYEN